MMNPPPSKNPLSGAAPIAAKALDPDTLLRRKPLAQALTELGFPTSETTLATKVTRGGGPPYRLYGRIPLYRWGDALAWAHSRLSAPAANSSAAHIISERSA